MTTPEYFTVHPSFIEKVGSEAAIACFWLAGNPRKNTDHTSRWLAPWFSLGASDKIKVWKKYGFVRLSRDGTPAITKAGTKAMFPEIPVIVNFSGGTQSKALLHKALRGDIDPGRVWAVIFADTGAEHRERYGDSLTTYEEVIKVRNTCKERGVPFFVADSGGLFRKWKQDIEGDTKRLDQPPAYVDKYNGGKGRIPGRCTFYAKITPMRRTSAAWLKAMHRPKKVRKWIALSADEPQRVANFRHDRKWELCEFPLFTAGIRKGDAIEYLKSIGETIPTRSLCVFCPHKSPEQWRELHGKDLANAIEVDELLREHAPDFGITEGDLYLSNELIPIRDLVNRPMPRESKDRNGMYCDSGHCFI